MHAFRFAGGSEASHVAGAAGQPVDASDDGADVPVGDRRRSCRSVDPIAVSQGPSVVRKNKFEAVSVTAMSSPRPKLVHQFTTGRLEYAGVADVGLYTGGWQPAVAPHAHPHGGPRTDATCTAMREGATAEPATRRQHRARMCSGSTGSTASTRKRSTCCSPALSQMFFANPHLLTRPYCTWPVLKANHVPGCVSRYASEPPAVLTCSRLMTLLVVLCMTRMLHMLCCTFKLLHVQECEFGTLRAKNLRACRRNCRPCLDTPPCGLVPTFYPQNNKAWSSWAHQRCFC